MYCGIEEGSRQQQLFAKSGAKPHLQLQQQGVGKVKRTAQWQF